MCLITHNNRVLVKNKNDLLNFNVGHLFLLLIFKLLLYTLYHFDNNFCYKKSYSNRTRMLLIVDNTNTINTSK